MATNGLLKHTDVSWRLILDAFGIGLVFGNSIYLVWF